MDALTFVAKLIEHSVWPISAIFLLLILRQEIRSLLPHIKKIKAGPVEAEFEREINEIKATAEAQLELGQDRAGTAEYQKLLQLVQINPRSAILEAWRDVEISSIRVVQNKALYVRECESHSPLAIIRVLNKERILSEEDVSLYYELRMLRNQAAHAEEFSPTHAAALNYVALANGLKMTLDEAARD